MGNKRYGFADLTCDEQIDLPSYISVHDKNGKFIEDIDCFWVEDEKKSIEDLTQELDFEHTYQYYDYIMDSITNGQNQQVRELWNNLSPEDKELGRTYYKGSYPQHSLLELLEIVT